MSLLTLRERLLSTELPAVSAPDPAPLKAPDALIHFMNRTSFGIRQAEFVKVSVSGLESWSESQLNPESLDDSALEAIIATNLKSIAMSGPELIAAYPVADNKDIAVLSELRCCVSCTACASSRK